MSAAAAGPRRPVVAGTVIAAVAALMLLDHATSEPIDYFQAPPPAALGSGLAAGGAHCAAPAPAAD